MANDLRNLDKVDLKYTHMPDPPMVAVTQSKHFNKFIWLIIVVAVVAAAGLGLYIYFANR